MKIYFFSVYLVFCNLTLLSQVSEPWIKFYDSTKGTAGYRDSKGKIRIPAEYLQTGADTFYNICSAWHKNGEQFYLLKNGNKVAKDSVFSFDAMLYPESEGKIIFENWKTRTVGFLNEKGEVIIPAEYNYVSNFHNGFCMAYRNGSRKCWGEDEDISTCEHWGWVNGETVVINDKNEVLIENFPMNDYNVNWYSCKINSKNVDTSMYVSFKGRNSRVYSFIDYNKEFKKWYSAEFIPALISHNNLSRFLFKNISFHNRKGIERMTKEEFSKQQPLLFSDSNFEERPDKSISIYALPAHDMLIESEDFRKFKDAAGNHNSYLHPLYTVAVTYYMIENGKIDKSIFARYEEYKFLKTTRGYQLIALSVSNSIN